MKKAIIKDPIYGCDLNLVWDCDKGEFDKWMGRKYDLYREHDPTTSAECLVVSRGRDVNYIIWMGKNKYSIKLLSTLVHELDHHVKNVFMDIGMDRNNATTEASAYYLEYLFYECAKKLAKKK